MILLVHIYLKIDNDTCRFGSHVQLAKKDWRWIPAIVLLIDQYIKKWRFYLHLNFLSFTLHHKCFIIHLLFFNHSPPLFFLFCYIPHFFDNSFLEFISLWIPCILMHTNRSFSVWRWKQSRTLLQESKEWTHYKVLHTESRTTFWLSIPSARVELSQLKRSWFCFLCEIWAWFGVAGRQHHL